MPDARDGGDDVGEVDDDDDDDVADRQPECGDTAGCRGCWGLICGRLLTHTRARAIISIIYTGTQAP